MTRLELPGFFDLQVNGFAGIDFNDPGTTRDDLLRAVEAIRATGVTRFLPTLITSPLDSFVRCARLLASFRHPSTPGLHMEGPYLAYEARGAHPPEHLRAASVDDFQRRQEAADGRIVLCTIAPEVPGAIALIEHMVAHGVRVAIGHTAASPEQVRDAVSAGATLSTHLGNGCPRTVPRHPNFIWEQLAADELVACLIADGHHLPASVVKVMVRAKGSAKTVLVTDAVAAAGQPPGRYSIGGVSVEHTADGRVVPLGGDGRLAGSALRLDVAVANAARFTGLPIETVWSMASAQAAAAIGMQPAGRVSARWDPAAARLQVEAVADA